MNMLLGILILAFILWLSIGFKKEEKNTPVKFTEKVCPPHKWTYYKPFEDRDDEYNICSICNKTPSQILAEGTRYDD